MTNLERVAAAENDEDQIRYFRGIERVLVRSLGQWGSVFAVAVVILGVGLLAVPRFGTEALAVALAGAVFALLRRAPRFWTAWLWGASLPIEVVFDLPLAVPDAWRYVGVVAIVLRYGRDVDLKTSPLRPWLMALASLALVRIFMSRIQPDHGSLVVGATMAVAAVPAYLVAVRAKAHLAVLEGFVLGVSVSAAAAVLQLAGLLRGNLAPGTRLRYPGLASKTTVLTWQVALAIVIAAYLLGRETPSGAHRRWPYLAIAICTFALLICGAQGGLVGLASAALLLWWRRRPSWLGDPRRRRIVAVTVAGTLLAGFAALFVGIDGFPPEKGFVNETSRVTVARHALHEMAAHPLIGIGNQAFADRYGILPHVVPLEVAVSAGIVGLVLALYLLWLLARCAWWGWNGNGPAPTLGAALAAIMVVFSMVEPAGPFIGVSRTTLLLLAVVAVGHRPARSSS